MKSFCVLSILLMISCDAFVLPAFAQPDSAQITWQPSSEASGMLQRTPKRKHEEALSEGSFEENQSPKKKARLARTTQLEDLLAKPELIQLISNHLSQQDYRTATHISPKIREFLTPLYHLKKLREIKDDPMGKEIPYSEFRIIHKFYISDTLNIGFATAEELDEFLSGDDAPHFKKLRFHFFTENNAQVVPRYDSVHIPKETWEKFERLSAVQTLNITGMIGDVGAKHLAQVQFSHLTKLNLSNTGIQAQGVKHLANGKLEALTHLDLSNNDIEDEGARHLANSTQLPQLKELILSNTAIESKGIEHLTHGAGGTEGKLTQLVKLDVSENSIGAAGTALLANGKLTHLKELVIENSDLDAAAVEHLANGNLSNLTKLDLTNNPIGPQGVAYLANGNLPNLTELILWNNDIGSEGAAHLANGKMTKLIKLMFVANSIGPEGVAHLANGNLPSLKQLDLSWNRIESQGVAYLTNGNLNGLTWLDLSFNKIGDQGAAYLIQGKDNLPLLTELVLSNTEVGSHQRDWVQQAFPKCPDLFLHPFVFTDVE